MIGKNTILKSNVKIFGPVIIGYNCIIKEHSIIGPNTSIGNDCNISKCQVSESIIMNNCNIDSDIKIRDSIIAYNSEIIINNQNTNEKKFLLGEGTKITL